MTLKVGDRRVADAIVKAVEERIMSRLGSYAFLEHRFGKVAGPPSNNLVSVYLGDDSYASPGFRVPYGMTVSTNYRVRVAIDPRGDRWIADVISTS